MIQISDTELAAEHPSFFQRRVVAPLLDLLRVGCSPRKLAWSLAFGILVGVNPLLGSTTVVSLVLAFALRLNLVASQIANHVVYPLQLALFIVFVGAGERLFHTGQLPMGTEALFHAARHHPLHTTRILWMWEWHALVAWALVSAITAPLLVAALSPMLYRLRAKLHREPVGV